MITDRVIKELLAWSQAAVQGDAAAARTHLQQFYHLGSSLVASKEFQAWWQKSAPGPLQPGQLDLSCKLLTAIADVEADQVQKYGATPS